MADFLTVLVPLLVALGGALLVAGLGPQFVRLLRGRAYVTDADWTTNDAMHALPSWSSGLLAHIQKEYSEQHSRIIRPLHGGAISAQHKYVGHSVRSVFLALYAFVALATSSVWRLTPSWELTALFAEVIGMGGTVLFFLSARRARMSWIWARLRSENERQGVALRILHPGTRAFNDDNNLLTSPHSTHGSAAIQDSLQEVSSPILATVTSRWQVRKQLIRSELIESQITIEQLAYYLGARVVGQLDWFQHARGRMQIREATRHRLLKGGFLLAGVVIIVKIFGDAFGLHTPAKEFLNVAALLAAALSGCVLAYNAAQNHRSLLHRYTEQISQIATWFQSFTRDHEQTLQMSPGTFLQRDVAVRVLEQVLAFEDLMVGELIQWLRITEHDSIELSL